MQAGTDPIHELFEHAPCGLALTSPRGEILAANRTLLGWLERNAEEVIGSPFSQLLPAAGRIYWETHIAPLLRMQGRVSEIAVELTRKDGTRIPCFLAASEAQDGAGSPVSIRIAVFQAADRRQYERELLLARRMAEQGMKAKADFLGVFAHEVRNSLSGISFAASVLERQDLPATATRPLATLRGALDRVIGLLQSMLDFSKVEAGKVELERRRFSLRELLQGVEQTLEAIAQKKGLTLELHVAPDCPEYLLGDPVKIGQVLTNLVGNAVKFTERGAVTLRAEALAPGTREATLRFSVRDTGIGIAPERIARIWDDYVQAGPEIGTRFGGTGLGLAISRRLVELHGSRIEVESRPGSGSTFWFDLSLPVAEAPARTDPASH